MKINFCSKMLISVLSLFTPNKSIPSAASQTSFMCVWLLLSLPFSIHLLFCFFFFSFFFFLNFSSLFIYYSCWCLFSSLKVSPPRWHQTSAVACSSHSKATSEMLAMGLEVSLLYWPLLLLLWLVRRFHRRPARPILLGALASRSSSPPDLRLVCLRTRVWYLPRSVSLR